MRRLAELSLSHCQPVTAGDSSVLQPLVVAKLSMLGYMDQCLLLRYARLCIRAVQQTKQACNLCSVWQLSR